MRASSRSQLATATAPPQQELTPAGPRALPALGAGLNAEEAAGLQGALGNEAPGGHAGRRGGGRDVSDPPEGADEGAGALPFQAQLEASFGEDLSHLDIQRGGAATPTLSALNAGGAHHDGGTLYLPVERPSTWSPTRSPTPCRPSGSAPSPTRGDPRRRALRA
ncbi:MAG: hypothetical protein IPN01_21090 [Deltaproteobacteria bacterium]|nr:hypothetical protein [Deltaproteobacteria bacterium]